MATATSNSSGAWSTDIWDGGSGAGGIPADGDDVVIAAGHEVLMDVDTSGWTGTGDVTITSHATDPGMLYFKNGTNGHLKVRTTKSIKGTNAAVKGRLLANSDGVWVNSTALTYTNKAVIDLTTTAKVDAAYLDIKLLGTEPTTNKYIEFFGMCYVVTMEADDDKVTCVSPSTTPPADGTPVYFSGTLPAELVAGTVYYTRDLAGSTIKIAATYGGDAINLTDDGSGTIYMHYGKWGPVAQATNVNTTTGVITWDGVPPAAGTAVMIRSSGTLPTGYAATDVYYTRTISGVTCKLASLNADVNIIIPTAVGSGNLSMYMGGTATTAATVNVVQDVTAETGWTTTDGHNHVGVVNCNAPSTYDQQRVQLTAITARYATLSAAVDSAQHPLARIFLSSRNVSIRSSCQATSTTIVDYSSATSSSGIFGCEIRSTYGTGTTFYGYAITSGTGHTISGVISGAYYALSNGATCTVSGSIIAGNIGISNGFNITVSGILSGLSVAVNGGIRNTFSGQINGSTSGVNGGFGNVLTGIISGCSIALNSVNAYTEVRGGILSGNGSAILGSCTLISATLRGNPADYRVSHAPIILRSTTTDLPFSSSRVYGALNQLNNALRIKVEHVNGVLDTHAIYTMFGNVLKTACDGAGTVPSVDPDAGNGYCIEVSSIQSNCSAIYPIVVFDYDEFKIWCSADVQKTFTFKVQAEAALAEGDLVLKAEWLNGTGGAMTITTVDNQAIAIRDDDTDWTETIAVTCTPAESGFVRFRMEVRDDDGALYIWPIPVIT